MASTIIPDMASLDRGVIYPERRCKQDYPENGPRPRTCPAHGLTCPTRLKPEKPAADAYEAMLDVVRRLRREMRRNGVQGQITICIDGRDDIDLLGDALRSSPSYREALYRPSYDQDSIEIEDVQIIRGRRR